MSITFIYAMLVFLAIGVFHTETLKTLVWPTLEMIKAVELPGGFLERIESLFLTVWTMTIFSTIAISHFLVGQALGQLFNRDSKRFVYAAVPVVYIGAMTPQNVVELFQFGKIVSIAGILFMAGISPILLLIARIRRLGNYGEK